MKMLKKRHRILFQKQAALDSSASSQNIAGELNLKKITLADLNPGECGDIIRLEGSNVARMRLMEMGLTPGVHVKVLRIAVFSGPMDIQIRGYHLSLRKEEAQTVLISAGVQTG